MSPNLALNELVARRNSRGESIVHLGFGEARLPPAGELVQHLTTGASRNRYGPVAGDEGTRAAVAGYFGRRGLPTAAEQVVLGPGSKPLLLALNLAIAGDVLLPRPCWNTYAPQAVVAGKRVFPVPIPAEAGGVPDPARLDAAIRSARAAGGDPRMLVVTLPDNPTGTVASPEIVGQVCAVAERHDMIIVSDEIYRDLVHDRSTVVLSPAQVAPERTIVTTGLSKSLALGGWRIGAARFPVGTTGRRIRNEVVRLASEMWSTLSGPMQEVARFAFDEPPEIRRRLLASARLHGRTARAVHAAAVDAGARCRFPTAAFYVYPDWEPLRDVLAERGVTDSSSLAHHLLDEFGIAVLGGHHLGDDPAALRFKAAVSTLYGESAEEQESALTADDPLLLPHVAEAIDRIARCFHSLGARPGTPVPGPRERSTTWTESHFANR